MGIKNKKIKENLDFEYECEVKNATDNENYEVKFHQSEEYGDTITILSGDTGIGYSANMLAEIIDFLRDRGLVDYPEGKEPPVEPDPRVAQLTPNAATVNTGSNLPLPQVFNNGENPLTQPMQKEVNASGESTPPQAVNTEYYQVPEVLDVAPVQSFTPPEIPTQQAVAPAPVAQATIQENTEQPVVPTDDVPDTPPELKEEANKMAMERAQAMAKAQTKPPKPSLRRVPDEDA